MEREVSLIRFNHILCEEMGQVFPLTPLTIDPDYKVKYSEKEGKGVFITSGYLACACTGGLRFGEMDFGGSMLVDYGSVPPAEGYDFPILGYDFVLSSRFLIAIIDLHPLSKEKPYMDRYIAPLEAVFQKYRWIPKTEGGRSGVHEWAKMYDSGFSLYRWCDTEYLPDVEAAFRDYVRVFCDCIRKAKPVTDQAALARRNEFVRKYQEDYTYKDPGSAPLKHHFGEEWGERYLRDFIFGS